MSCPFYDNLCKMSVMIKMRIKTILKIKTSMAEINKQCLINTRMEVVIRKSNKTTPKSPGGE